MAHILVFLQQNEGRLIKAALAAITAARELCAVWRRDGLVGVCLGQGAAKAADEAMCYGFSQVFYSQAAVFEKYLAPTYAQALRSALAAGACDVLVAAATSTGKDVAPRFAGLVDAGQVSEIVGVNQDGSLKRLMFAGNVLADVELLSAARAVTVRATAFALPARGAPSGAKSELAVSVDAAGCGGVLSYQSSKGGRPDLADADAVVSGGRALQSADNFERILFPLADALGAAVGASRAAVDAGYAPNDWQVGQTGKVVAPSLYIAAGISGAIQHIAGMKDSKVVVAINKDAQAPIFEVADYALVADLFTAVPELVEEIKKLKS